MVNAPELSRKTSLDLPEKLSLRKWQRIGENLHVIADSSRWWLADWLLYGQHHYPDRYRTALAETRLDYQTLRNYAWIASRFSPSRRRPALSFQHHAEVAALPEGQQDYWLDKAQQSRWSRNRLRAEVRAARRDDPEPRVRPGVRVSVSIAAGRVALWQEAARENRQDLLEWMTAVLDDAAADENQVPSVPGPVRASVPD